MRKCPLLLFKILKHLIPVSLLLQKVRFTTGKTIQPIESEQVIVECVCLYSYLNKINM